MPRDTNLSRLQSSFAFPGELIIDLFAGGGGASEGIEQAFGRAPDIAINHCAKAVSMHQANHPATKHFVGDVFEVDPLTATGGQQVGLLWASPDCKHFSKAKGGKPVSKKIRSLAWVVIKWARAVRPRMIMLENVEEFQTWGPLGADDKPCPKRKGETFAIWIAQLRKAGYQVEYRELRACDYGAPTIRKRLFLIARRDKLPIVWPAPTHGSPSNQAVKRGKLALWRTAAECIDWSLPTHSIFLTPDEARAVGVRRPLADATLRRIARGVDRYVIQSAAPFIVPIAHYNGSTPAHSVDEPMRTVTASPKGGTFALVAPSLVHLTHQGDTAGNPVDEPLRTVTGAHRGEQALIAPVLAVGGRAGQSRPRTGDEPMATLTAKADTVLVAPVLVQAGYGEREGQAPRSLDIEQPLGTVVATGKHALVSAFLAQHNAGHNEGVGRPATEPVSTVCSTGSQQGLVAVHLQRDFGHSVGSSACEPVGTITAGGGGKAGVVASSLVKLRGTCRDGQPIDEPAPTVTASGTHVAEVRAFLIAYYGAGGQDGTPADPMRTIPTKDRIGLVYVHGEPYEIVDIGMRMLSPRELFRAQGFPDTYIIDKGAAGEALTKTDQVRLCGNSVCPPIAKAMVLANCAALIAIERATA